MFHTQKSDCDINASYMQGSGCEINASHTQGSSCQINASSSLSIFSAIPLTERISGDN